MHPRAGTLAGQEDYVHAGRTRESSCVAVQADRPLFRQAVLFRGRLEGGRAQTVGRRGDERRGRLPLSNATERPPARGRQSYSAQGSRPFRITDWYDGARRRGCWGRLCIRACAREDRPAVRAAFLRLLPPFRDAQLLRETDVSNAG